VLSGGDITFMCPGQWSAKGSAQAFLGGGGTGAQPNALPVGLAGEAPNWLDLELRGWEAAPLKNIPYTVTFADGSKRQGTLDDKGYASLTGVPKKGVHKVEYKNPPTAEDPKPYSLDDLAKSIKAYLA
jgi:type VI secretion system secreted protein VgrG